MLTHHAYYHEGSLSEFDALKAELKPFVAQRHERFGVDEARALIALASLKNFTQATFLVGASSITSEAQQALLKLLEEPQEGTVFVLLVPHGALLPTVRSRMLNLADGISDKKSSGRLSDLNQSVLSDTPVGQYALEFLSSSPKERSDMVTKMLKDEDGVRERVLNFVNGLERLLAADVKKNVQALEDIAMVRDYLADRSPSIKMLLEHLALALPTA